MNNRQKLTMVGAASFIALSGGLFAQNVSAHEAGAASDLVAKIAEKFNLNKDEVQKVFDENRQEKEAAMQEKIQQRLEDAVTEGDLTEEQKKLIIAKQAEMKARMEEIKAMTDDVARKEAMKQQHEALKAWADEHDIDLRWLRPFGGGRHSMGPGGPGIRGEMPPAMAR